MISQISDICNWNEEIPIEMGEEHFQIVEICRHEHQSFDGQQYAQIIEESEEVIIQIFQVKNNQLLHTLRFPQIKDDKFQTRVDFSSEYFIFARNLKHNSAQVYVHNFKTNKGKYFFFKQSAIDLSFYTQDESYILLSNQLGDMPNLYKVDNDFNLIQTAIEQLGSINFFDILQVVRRGPIFLIMLGKEKELIFLSNQLKSINKVLYEDQGNFGMFSHKPIFHLMKDMFLIDEVQNSQLLLAQNRNGKRIRKINFFQKQDYNFPIAILQHYLFACLNSSILKVYDLKKGIMVGNLNLKDKGQIHDIKVTDDYFTIEINKVNWGWPIRKQK